MTISVDIKRLDREASIPSQAKYSDAGYDLASTEAYDLAPGERMDFHTGIALAIPEGYVGYIKPRSGLALRRGIDVLGGVIDSGYRGEIKVILLNTGSAAVAVSPGDRIAQLVVQPVMDVMFVERTEFIDQTHRGHNGFGSTGAR